MQFGGPDNRFLVASGNVGDGGVVVFERVGKGDEFQQVASNKDIPNLTSFVGDQPVFQPRLCRRFNQSSFHKKGVQIINRII